MWEPHHSVGPYPPCLGHISTCFLWHSHLSVIVGRTYWALYAGPNRPRELTALPSLEAQLGEMRIQMPHEILLDSAGLPPRCPPSHLFALNALLRLASILLYRPFLCAPSDNDAPPESTLARLRVRAMTVCKTMAAELDALFRLRVATFGHADLDYATMYVLCLSWRRQLTLSHSNSYCAYASATVNAILIRDSDDGAASAAAERLALLLHLLDASALPGTKRAVDLVKRQLGAPVAPAAKKRRSAAPSSSSTFSPALPSQALPAATISSYPPVTSPSASAYPWLLPLDYAGTGQSLAEEAFYAPQASETASGVMGSFNIDLGIATFGDDSTFNWDALPQDDGPFGFNDVTL